VCGHQLLACEHWAEAVEIFRLAARSGDATGTIGRSALCRRFGADILWRTGRWAESLAEATQALSLLDSIRPGHIRPSTLALLARIEAGLGHEDACRAHAAEALATPPRADIHDLAAHSAVGLLELGLGRWAAAAEVFDLVAARAADVPEPGWLWWQGDAVDAYLGAGRTADARRLLDTLAAQADATGRGWARAVVSRGRGRLDGSDDLLTSSIAGFRAVGAPFEEARSLLARGELLLAAGPASSEEGAADIAAARAGFDRLGAAAWSARASAVTGDTPSPGDALTSLLTPAELRVALAVGHGASNRGAAEQLFISAKTVDHHLQSIYRKLNLRSRTQLVAHVLRR
jgi:DNA-binding CsgD family transcriptional regulator